MDSKQGLWNLISYGLQPCAHAAGKNERGLWNIRAHGLHQRKLDGVRPVLYAVAVYPAVYLAQQVGIKRKRNALFHEGSERQAKYKKVSVCMTSSYMI